MLQVKAFRRGFNDFGDVTALQMFSAPEMASIFSDGGATSHVNWHPWRRADIEPYIVCTHGYKPSDAQVCITNNIMWLCREAPRCPLLTATDAWSQQVQQLIEVLCSLDRKDQRLFMRFITGSPRLPLGGFAALRPRLQVVRAVPPAGEWAQYRCHRA